MKHGTFSPAAAFRSSARAFSAPRRFKPIRDGIESNGESVESAKLFISQRDVLQFVSIAFVYFSLRYCLEEKLMCTYPFTVKRNTAKHS